MPSVSGFLKYAFFTLILVGLILGNIYYFNYQLSWNNTNFKTKLKQKVKSAKSAATSKEISLEVKEDIKKLQFPEVRISQIKNPNPLYSSLQKELNKRLRIKKSKLIQKQKEKKKNKQKEKTKESKSQPQVSKPQIKINAIIGTQERKTAIIKVFGLSHIVKSGEKINKMKILNITKDGVMVKYYNRIFEYSN